MRNTRSAEASSKERKASLRLKIMRPQLPIMDVPRNVYSTEKSALPEAMSYWRKRKMKESTALSLMTAFKTLQFFSLTPM
jgi:hypothetical protein